MMKKFTILLALILSNFSLVQAQNIVDPTNCRDGEAIEFCRQHILQAELMKDPEYKKQFEKAQAEMLAIENDMKAKGKNDVTAKTAIYRIPIVFHVLHNGGPENISHGQIMDALYILNRDFNLQNADANDVYTPFQGMPADVQIEFVLATKAPNGACFSGVTRTKNALSEDGSSGWQQVGAIVNGNDVYQGQWPGNEYLNVFICADLGSAAGYTTLPSGNTNMTNGIWMLHDYTGSFGTSTVNRSRALTHEVGHWLNLPHTWGGSNSPGLASNCNTDDGVTDTPNTRGVTSCFYFENFCGPVANVENYMDYSYCSKMFTNGQKAKMHAALNSGSGGRSNVVSANNLAAVGADSNIVLCKADFTSSKVDVCEGDSTQFFDLSYHNIQSWNWSFPGGTPSTSTLKDPVVTYSSPGTYAVTLIVTDAASNTMTKSSTAHIKVIPAGVTLPYLESFEGYTSLSAANSFWRVKSDAGNQFEVYTGAGSEGNKSVRLQNFGQPAGGIDELLSNSFDLSGVVSPQTVTFSFKYAYRKKTSADYEVLRMEVSKDCGNTWTVRKTISGPSLSSVVATSSWVPTVNDWVQVHVTGINANYFISNLQTKFNFTSDGGNNLYLDQINFYTGPPGTASLNEMDALQNVNLYPNPTDGDVNVRFSVLQSSLVTLTVQDLTGKVLETHRINAEEGENLVLMDTEKLAAGLYFMNVQSGNSTQTLQFVVK